MTDALSGKVPAIQAVAMRLAEDLGPQRLVVVVSPEEDAESLTVALKGDIERRVFISTAGMAEGRYRASYEEKKLHRKGDASIECTTSANIVYPGLRWIVEKVFEDGMVTPEFDDDAGRPPRRTRQR